MMHIVLAQQNFCTLAWVLFATVASRCWHDDDDEGFGLPLGLGGGSP